MAESRGTNKMANHLIVVSVDALVYEDLELLGKQTNVKRLLENGSLVRHMRTVYPSLTHIVHTTLMTGCTPDKTGIIANEHFEPGNARPSWYNNLNEVQCETLFHAAKKKGLRTCSCRWPLTAGGFDVIDYLVPEIMDEDREGAADLLEVHRKMCSPEIYEDIILPNIGILDWSKSKHPTDEEFQITCACDIIRKYKPNLVLTHPSFVDDTRHRYGLFSDKLNEALIATDRWIGMLLDAVRDAGIEDDTNIAIVSDHGHLEEVRSIAFNVFLTEKGYIDTDEQGKVTDWRAYAKGCGLSAEIYVSEAGDKEAVYQDLCSMARAGIYGISEVLTAEEAETRYGICGAFSFIVETDGYSDFCDEWLGEAVIPAERAAFRYGHSDHGHMPEKGPQPPMIVCGPDFKQGEQLDKGKVVDEAPTFARVLGLDLPEAQGRVMEALLR